MRHSDSFADRQARFQREFEVYDGYGPPEATVVVVPSLSLDETELQKITGVTYYEHRLLCLLLLLADSRRRVIFTASMPVDPVVLDYYLGLVPNPDDLGQRLGLVTLRDPAPTALTKKLLGSPDVLRRLGDFIDDDPAAYLLPFNVTDAERHLSDRLGLPIFGPRPDQAALGSKSGSRRVAREAGVPVLEGYEDLSSTGELDHAISQLVAGIDPPDAVVVKLDNGFSGQGNAIIDCRNFTPPVSGQPTTFCADGETWATFGPKIDAEGAIVERLLTGGLVASPSVQVRIAPNGDHEIISTHDQVLGGQYSQVYLGCRFPADAAYREEITELAHRVAGHLSERGVMGTFGMDFFVQSAAFSPRVALAEINLRLGGTTHPNVMAQLLTRATYHPGRGELLDAGGQPVCYVASDNIKSPQLVGVQPAEALDALARAGLLYDAARGGGATCHLLGALPVFGKMGVTCLARTVPDAEVIFRRVGDVLAGLSPAQGCSRMPQGEP